MIRVLLTAATLVLGVVRTQAQLTLSWTNNLLTIAGSELPGNKLEVWYLEAFCRRGSTKRDWRETTFLHKTELLASDSKLLKFRTRVQPNVEVLHEVYAGANEVSFEFNFTNHGTNRADIEWFQPACIRVERFTARQQSNYTDRAFIFTAKGLTRLADTRRTEEALYRGGQVYVPAGINLADVNPRPICGDRPVNGLIGCFSADDRYILATASDQTHELFEGVYVCLHSDPHVGGLAPSEKKTLRSKIYLLKNDVAELKRRYERDFGSKKP
ncbi:MAG TPA: hypothetical protein VK530_03835 [Candidatus Acidoferrum sp.]|nr:hypothetical protein [Candidatus Acidoferrum sp.]